MQFSPMDLLLFIFFHQSFHLLVSIHPLFAQVVSLHLGTAIHKPNSSLCVSGELSQGTVRDSGIQHLLRQFPSQSQAGLALSSVSSSHSQAAWSV